MKAKKKRGKKPSLLYKLRHPAPLPPLEGDDIVLLRDTSLALERRAPQAKWYVRLFLLGLCTLSFLASFLTLYQLPVSLVSPVALGVCLVGVCLLYTLFKYPLAGTGAVLFAAVSFGLFKSDALFFGFEMFFNRVIELLNWHTFEFLIPYRIPPLYDQPSNERFFVNFALCCILFVIGVAILYRPNIFLYLAATFLPLLPGLFYGLTPSYLPFLLLAASYALVLSLHLATRHPRAKRDFSEKIEKKTRAFRVDYRNYSYRYATALKSGCVLIGLCLCCLAAGGLIISPPLYNSRAFTSFRNGAGHKLSEVSMEKEPSRILSLYRGQLSRLGIWRNYDAANDLMIRAPTLGQSIYLKGYVGGIYRGDRWDTLDEEAEQTGRQAFGSLFSEAETSPQNLPSDYIALCDTIDNPVLKGVYLSHATISVEGLKDTALKQFTYVPYGAVYPWYIGEEIDPSLLLEGEELPERETAQTDLDSTIWTDNNRWAGSYDFDFYTTPNLLGVDMDTPLQEAAQRDRDAAAYARREAAYRRFVYQTYTQVPENIQKVLTDELFTPQALAEAGDLATYTDWVRSYLNEHYHYNPAPGSTPDGQDFVEYFLTQRDSGFATHFASAGAMMLRSAGVPARYVEGYALTPQTLSGRGLEDEKVPIEQPLLGVTALVERRGTMVSGSTMHAWVEIYLDGFGWVPVEMTPYRSIEYDTLPVVDGEVAPPIISGGGGGGAGSGDPSDSIGGGSVTFDGVDDPLSIFDTWRRPLKNAPWTTIVWTGVVWLGGLIAVAAVFLALRRFVRIHRFKRSLETDEPRRNIIRLYRYLLQALDFFSFGYTHAHSYYGMASSIEVAFGDHLEHGEALPIIELVLEAGFSQHQMTPEQFREFLVFVDRFIRSVSKDQNIFKKLSFRFLHALW